MQRLFDGALILIIATTIEIAPAMAGMAPGTPAPVVGLGIPAIAAFGLLYKRMRNRKDR